MRQNTCGYSTEWQLYNNDYDKLEYDIKLKDGTIVNNCYPNAGYFNPIGKTMISGDFVYLIRITPKENQKFFINPNSVYD